jgi:O-antigen ligase
VTFPYARVLFGTITFGVSALLLAPIIVTPQTLSPYAVARTVFFRTGVEILLVFYLVLIFLDGRFRPPQTPLTLWVLAYLGALLLTTFNSADPRLSWWGNLERLEGTFGMLHYGVFFLMLSGLYRTRQDWLSFATASLLVSVVVSQVGVRMRLAYGPNRYGSTLGHPVDAGCYALFQIFFAALLLHWERQRIWRLFGAAALGLNLITLFLTADRGAAVGLYSGLVVLAASFLIFNRPRGVGRGLGVAGLIFLLAAPWAVLAGRSTRAVRWSYALERMAETSSGDPSLNARLITLGVSWQAFKAKPLLGFGPEMFDLAATRYFDSRQLSFDRVGWFDRAHNKLADVAVMEGLIGLVPYVAIFVAAVSMLHGAMRRRPIGRLGALLALGMLVAYFVQNLFLFDSPVSYILFYALLAFITFLSEESLPSPQTVLPEKLGAERPVGLALWQQVVVGLATVTMVFCAYEFNIRAFRQAQWGGRLMASINDPRKFLENLEAAVAYRGWPTHEVLDAAANALYASGELRDPAYWYVSNQVAAELEREIAGRSTRQPRTCIRLGRLYGRMAVIDRLFLAKSESTLKQAIELAPRRPEAYSELAKTYLREGKEAEAIALSRKALDINPDNGAARWPYALVLFQTHREKDGLAELEVALKNYDYHNRNDLRFLSMTYYQFRNYVRALEYEKELTALEPIDARHHAALAQLYSKLGDVGEASREMQVAHQLDAHYSVAATPSLDRLPDTEPASSDPGCAGCP